MFTHCAHACERACAWLSIRLTMETILLKFAVNILQLTTSSKVYVVFMFTHHACERVWVRAWLHIQLSLDGFSSNMDMHILQMTTRYTACTRVRACMCERACASIQQIHRGYISHIICVWMHVLTARTSIYSRICQARDANSGWILVICIIYAVHTCMTFTKTAFNP
jgi:hypothetical protein